MERERRRKLTDVCELRVDIWRAQWSESRWETGTCVCLGTRALPVRREG